MSTVVRRLIVHQVSNPAVLLGPNPPFPARGYSWFKHGSTKWAQRFSRELIVALGGFAPETITSSAFRWLPTSANAVTEFTHTDLTLRGINHRLARIYRGQLTHGDYGRMSDEQRELIMRSSKLGVDTSLITGRRVLVIDDVRITGAHEQALEAFLVPLGPTELVFAYIAAIDEAAARLDPTIEDKINHAAVANLDDLMSLIEAREFILNARSCKFILSPKNRDELRGFLRWMPTDLLTRFYMGSVCDDYMAMDLYRDSFEILAKEYDRRLRGATQLLV